MTQGLFCKYVTMSSSEKGMSVYTVVASFRAMAHISAYSIDVLRAVKLGADRLKQSPYT